MRVLQALGPIGICGALVLALQDLVPSESDPLAPSRLESVDPLIEFQSPDSIERLPVATASTAEAPVRVDPRELEFEQLAAVRFADRLEDHEFLRTKYHSQSADQLVRAWKSVRSAYSDEVVKTARELVAKGEPLLDPATPKPKHEGTGPLDTLIRVGIDNQGILYLRTSEHPVLRGLKTEKAWLKLRAEHVLGRSLTWEESAGSGWGGVSSQLARN